MLATFRFCPSCGGTIAHLTEGMPGVTAIPVGAFADPGFPPPTISVYEEKKHPWVAVLAEDLEHLD